MQLNRYGRAFFTMLGFYDQQNEKTFNENIHERIVVRENAAEK